MSRRNGKRRAGFTLTEVLLSIALLLLLGTVSVVSYSKIRDSSQKDTAKVLVGQVESAVENYSRVMSNPPGDDEGLAALVTRPDDENQAKAWDSGGPFLKGGKIPLDSWKTEVAYKRVDDDTANRTGVYFHVYSCGPNRTDDSGTGDDIPAWAEER